MKDHELLNLLIKNGWTVQQIKGSHYHLKKDGTRETIAVHHEEMNSHLVKRIIEKHGLK